MFLKKKNRVLVTGNLGYIGSVLTDILYEKNYDVVGLDIGYYKDCLIKKPKHSISQIISDIRDITKSDLKNFDSIIHLASLSNDPLGEFNPKLTEDINYKSTVKLANIAKDIGVNRFVFVSTQSLYGISKVNEELDEVVGEKNPLTSYAITKWKSEIDLNKLISDKFCVVSYRPSTVFGSSPRFRSDIVFNNFIACAYTTGCIEIKSDGTPWRPVIHVKDVCDAFISGLEAPVNIINGNAYNVGIRNGNYTVKDLLIEADLVISSKSIVCLEALSLGIPTLVFEKPNTINFNPIPSEIEKILWKVFNNSDELYQHIVYFEKRDNNKIISDIKLSNEIRESYFEKINKKNVEKFIK